MVMLHLYDILLCLMTVYDSFIYGSEVKSKLSIIDLATGSFCTRHAMNYRHT